MIDDLTIRPLELREDNCLYEIEERDEEKIINMSRLTASIKKYRNEFFVEIDDERYPIFFRLSDLFNTYAFGDPSSVDEVITDYGLPTERVIGGPDLAEKIARDRLVKFLNQEVKRLELKEPLPTLPEKIWFNCR